MNTKLKKLMAITALLAVVLSANAFAFRPIFHPPTVSILDALRNDQENFSTLIGLVRESGLDELTKEGRSFTLLAPTNAAFAKLPDRTLAAFKKDKNRVRELLLNHLFAGKILFKETNKAEGVSDPCILHPKTFTNLAGGRLEYRPCNENKAFAETVHLPFKGTARVLASDFEGRSAAIQVIDTVLLPDDNSASIGVDSGRPVRNETANGLNTTTFDTLVGTVTVNLPDDLAAGDTISGTVIAEVKKADKSPRDQPMSLDELSGYVVEIAEQATPMKKPDGNLIDFCKDPAEGSVDKSINVCKKWTVPEGVAKIPVLLKDREGKVVGRSEVPVGPKANVARSETPSGMSQYPPKYFTPAVGQAGKPISVKGLFDGDFANAKVKIGCQTMANTKENIGCQTMAKFLASSPRKIVVESPRDLKGINDIEVEYKGMTVARCTYRSIGIRLAADKLNLIKGEQTNLTITLSGLVGLLSPISMQLMNKSPGTVSMAGGETQTINVSPAEVNGDSFTAKRTLTGVKAGGFSINALVDPSRSVSDCSSEIAGNLPRMPRPQPSPGNPNPQTTGTPGNIDADGNPRTNNGPGQPVNPMRGRFRVTLNGFRVHRVTNHGLFQRPDAVTFHPTVGRANADGTRPTSVFSGDTSTIGMTPENRVQGGTSSPSGGFQTDDGFPTRDAPWVRTLPTSSAPLTIPPTVYFEGEIIQHTNATYIIPNIWSVDGQSNLDLLGSYRREIGFQLDSVARAVGRMIVGPQPLALASYLKPGARMGLNNTVTLDRGVMQNRPIGMDTMGGTGGAGRTQFGFRPQVLVLTYDSADFMSRNSFGFGTGIVPVRYTDVSEFGGDYTLFLHVERMDTMAACAENIIGSRFIGTGNLTTTRAEAPGPFPSDVDVRADFIDCRSIIRITDFTPLTSDSITGLGPNRSTMTLASGGSGTFAASGGRIEMPVTLALQNSLRVFGNSTLPLTLTGSIDPATGIATLRGTGTFSGGSLGTYQGTVVVTGTFSPSP